MGAAWCRDRVAASHGSKNPLDRVIVQCVSQICPGAEHRTRAAENNNIHEAERSKNRPVVSVPVPVHTRHRPISATHALNASSKWEDVSLSVPDTPDVSIVPVPPPRKKKIWREQQRLGQCEWMSVPRPPPPQPPTTETASKKKRRQKTLSTVSLPNYNDLSLSVFTEKPSSGQKTPPRNESCISLPGKSTGLTSLSEATVEKIENCVRRCRSFGAFKPEQQKLKAAPTSERHSSESEDSFDGLDDWDLRVIEHCEAHEVSPPSTMLPPQRLRRTPQPVTAPMHLKNSVSPVEKPMSFVSTDTGIGSECGSDGQKVVNEISTKSSDSDIYLQISLSREGKSTSDAVDGESEVQNDPDKPVVVYDFIKPKRSPDSRQPIVNGFHDIPTGLKTPPPSPEEEKMKSNEKWSPPEEHSSLLRLLKEYQTADGKMEDSGAQQVLRDLGLPPTLRDELPGVHKGDCHSRGSSGRSSMTPSLSELEAALSDLLEASADKEDEEVTPVSKTAPLQNRRVISPKPFVAFNTSFHPMQSGQGSHQQETSA